MALLNIGKGMTVAVDDCDVQLVRSFSWSVQKCKGYFYAATKVSGRSILMHRYIIGAPRDSVVDHIDQNGLNNCRSNLRIATRMHNAANGYAHRDNALGFKGVRRHRNYYAAQIRSNGVSRTIGYYRTVEEAAMAYDYTARVDFGEFARLNFPFDDEQSALRQPQ